MSAVSVPPVGPARFSPIVAVAAIAVSAIKAAPVIAVRAASPVIAVSSVIAASSVSASAVIAASIIATSVIPLIPGARANEDAVDEEARTVVSIWRAGVWIIRIVAIRANGRCAVICGPIVVVA
jgi:hypothetical protein